MSEQIKKAEREVVTVAPREKTRKSMADWFESFCKNMEYIYKREDDDNWIIFRLNFEIDYAVGSVRNFIIFDDDFVTVLGKIDANAGTRTAEVGEFLMRLNNDDYFGHMQLDYDEGDISYQAYRFYEEFNEEDDFYRLKHCAASRFGDVGESLMKVIQGLLSPKEAYDEVQKRMEENARKEREEEVDEAEDGER